MKKIDDYIIEKFQISKDIEIKKSKYSDIYNVDVGDIVLVMQGYTHRADIYVQLYPVKIEKINDNKLEVYNIENNSKIEPTFTFNDNKKLPPIHYSFAFFREKGKYWLALIRKDKAINMIKETLRRYPKGNIIYFNTFRLDGTNKRKKLENLLDVLNEKS